MQSVGLHLEPRSGRVSPPLFKPVRRACALGWTFGQNALALLTHVSKAGSGSKMQCSLAGLTHRDNSPGARKTKRGMCSASQRVNGILGFTMLLSKFSLKILSPHLGTPSFTSGDEKDCWFT